MFLSTFEGPVTTRLASRASHAIRQPCPRNGSLQHRSIIAKGQIPPSPNGASTVVVSPQAVEDAFISALVSAGQCRSHRIASRSPKLLTNVSKISSCNIQQSCQRIKTRRSLWTQATDARPQAQTLAHAIPYDYMNEFEADEVEIPNQVADDQTLQVRKQPRITQKHSVKITQEHRTIRWKMKKLLLDPNSPYGDLLDLYYQLPGPRALYVTRNTINNLLHHLAQAQRHSYSVMPHYLAILDDIRAVGRPLTRYQWSTGLAMAGQWSKSVSEESIQNALKMWKDMENNGKLPANHVTFNTLFDVAVKAGKFSLAEMIHKEMIHRDVKFDKFFRTSLMLCYGLRRDGDGVRKAFSDLVEAGEVVDSTVVTCLISALLHAGEPTAAEEVFTRSKQLQAKRLGRTIPVEPLRQAHDAGSLLKAVSPSHAKDFKRADEHQQAATIGPTQQTYLILIKYYAVVLGDIDRVHDLLTEMQEQRLQVPGSIYYHIFKGFTAHGGVLYTAWTGKRLDSFFDTFTKALDESQDGYHFGRAMLMVCLSAFDICADERRTQEVWDMVKKRWWWAPNGPPPATFEMAKGHFIGASTRISPELSKGTLGRGHATQIESHQSEGNW